MSFWELSDGESAKDTGTEYEVPGGNMEPIPNNSDVLAQIDEIKWQKKETGERFIEARWSVIEPAAFANRKVFHKLWVDDLDPMAKSEDKAKTKRDKARRMLASIDANAGGKLMQSADAPTDDALALALCNKPMVIKVMIWEIADSRDPGNMMRGNWVSAVKPKDAPLNVGDAAPESKPSGGGARSSGQAQTSGGGFEMDDEIPF
jgi:hypothetical protein